MPAIVKPPEHDNSAVKKHARRHLQLEYLGEAAESLNFPHTLALKV